ncbi:MAG: DUF2752 domain-containing protein [Planctomycetota bacterium]
MESVEHSRFLGPRFKVALNTRLAWGGVALVCISVVGIAAWLRPDPSGLGTHRQLFNSYPCSFVVTTGLPCPTCGMTTAFAEMVHGHPYASFIAQPAGAVFCLATIGMAVFGLWVAVSGNMVSVNWERIGPTRFMLGLGFLILGGWVFKLAHGLITGKLPMK